MDLFISLSRGDIFATKKVHFDLLGLLCHLRNGFINTRDQQNHLETSWYFEKSESGSEFSMMMKMLEVLMLLMMVINLQECLFRNRKHCCFCVCSNYRVDVRMSAASGGKFCVNIFCFRDPPPPHCVVFTFRFPPTRNMLLQGSNSTTPSSEFNLCSWHWIQSLISNFVANLCLCMFFYIVH